jgi:hypothetical protein
MRLSGFPGPVENWWVRRTLKWKNSLCIQGRRHSQANPLTPAVHRVWLTVNKLGRTFEEMPERRAGITGQDQIRQYPQYNQAMRSQQTFYF